MPKLLTVLGFIGGFLGAFLFWKYFAKSEEPEEKMIRIDIIRFTPPEEREAA